MKRPTNILGISYIILILLLSLSMIFYFIIKDSEVRSFLLNLSTEIIGIILTVFLIDSVIRRNELKEKNKLLAKSFYQLRFPLTRHLHVMFDLYKASITSRPENIKDDFSEILSSKDYYESIKYFDFKAKAPVTPQMLWFEYLKYQTEEFKNSIEKTLEKYSFTLDSEIIGDLEGLINSHFYTTVNMTYAVYKRGGSFTDSRIFNNDIDHISTYNNLLLNLLKHYNNHVEENMKINFDKGLWRNDIAPSFGQAKRINNFV